MKKVIRVEGMSCSHCVQAVGNAINALDGVSKVEVSLDSNTAEVEYDESKVDSEKLYLAVENIGFDVVR